MTFKLPKTDNLKVLTSTKFVVENLKHVIINELELEAVSEKVAQQMEKGLETAEEGFGATLSYEDNVQLIFLQDVVNFCFWAEKDQPKWQIDWPVGNTIKGGGYAMIACFKRAVEEKVPILDANYLSGITNKQVADFFRSSNGTEIPLLNKRRENLQEAGSVMKEKYAGKFINALEKAQYDAVKLVNLIQTDFSSFQDVAQYDDKVVYFLKRAQIAANDLSYLSKRKNSKSLSNLDQLTAFADYKIPQMLRMYGVISYTPELEAKIDNYDLIPSGSAEEIEIRAATVWSVELIKQKLEKYSSAEIDNALWLISQDQRDTKPYHRTYTIYY